MKVKTDLAGLLSLMYGLYHACRGLPGVSYNFYLISLGFSPADLFAIHSFHSISCTLTGFPVAVYADSCHRRLVIALGLIGVIFSYIFLLFAANQPSIYLLVYCADLFYAFGHHAICGTVEGWLLRILIYQDREQEYPIYAHRIQTYSALFSILSGTLGFILASHGSYQLCYQVAGAAMLCCFCLFLFIALQDKSESVAREGKKADWRRFKETSSVAFQEIFSSHLGRIAMGTFLLVHLARYVSAHYSSIALFGVSTEKTLPRALLIPLIACNLGACGVQHLLNEWLKRTPAYSKTYYKGINRVLLLSALSCFTLFACARKLPLILLVFSNALSEGGVGLTQTLHQNLYVRQVNPQVLTSTLSVMGLLARLFNALLSSALKRYGTIDSSLFIIPCCALLGIWRIFLYWEKQLSQRPDTAPLPP